MRHPLVPALLVVLLLGAYALAGAAVVGGAAPDEQVTIDGTVTGPDGGAASDAVVLVGEYAMLTKLSPDDLREVAAGEPQDVTVVEVGADGGFATTVAWERADAAVALDDDGISEVVRLGHDNVTLSLALHERRPQVIHAAASSVSHGETETRLFVSLVNNGDEPVENLSVAIEGLPDGWSVAGVETAGTYDAETGTMTWASVPAGAEVDTTVTLTVPADAAVGEYGLTLSAESDSHPVSVDGATVEVLPEETAGPTKTVAGGDGDDATPTSREDGTISPPPTAAGTASPTPSPVGTTSPGFGALVTAVAAGLAALVVRRRRTR